MTKNKKIGWALLVGPFCTLIAIVIIYAIAQFVMSSVMQANTPEISPNSTNSMSDFYATELAPASTSGTTAKIINAILGLIGLLSVIGIFVGIPLGIYFLSKKEPEELVAIQSNPKFQGLAPEQIAYITGWSWGAFFGTLIWLIGNKLYIYAAPFIGSIVVSLLGMALILFDAGSALFALLSLLNFPLSLLCLIFWIYTSIKGRQMSWEKGWTSFDAFKSRQKLMVWVILGVVLVMSILQAIFFIWMSQNIRNSVSDSMTKDECYSQCTGSAADVAQCRELCDFIIK
jgi:hypothetical protein